MGHGDSGEAHYRLLLDSLRLWPLLAHGDESDGARESPSATD
jgi:hypothetical protein